jgi:Cu2+-exporting ATPase
VSVSVHGAVFSEVHAAREKCVCLHCTTPFVATETEKDFCCPGCRYVYGVISGKGLEQFYGLASGSVRQPAGTTVFQVRNYAWLEDLQRSAEREGRTSVPLSIQGVTCSACVWLIENLFREWPGAVDCRIDSMAGYLELRWNPGECDLPAFAQELQRFGYLIGPPGEDQSRAQRELTRKLGLCAALAMNLMLFSLPHYFGLEADSPLGSLFAGICFLLATLSLLAGGMYFARHAIAGLRAGRIHMDLPIALGLLLAYGGSVMAWRMGRSDFAYFDFVGVFTMLMLGGRWIQQRSLEAHRSRLLAKSSFPDIIRVESVDGDFREVPLSSLAAGALFHSRRGEPVPVRSRVQEDGGCEFELSWITGEPEPRLVANGGIIPAGAVPLRDADLRALETWEDSALKRLLQQERGERSNPVLQKIISIYLPLVIVVAALGALRTWHGTGDAALALQVLISVLVVSCPCAAGVAGPLADEWATALARDAGVFVKRPGIWQRLRQVRRVVFDKTGTITLETPQLANPRALEELPADARGMLAVLVSESMHPLAASLREALLSRWPGIGEVGSFRVHEIAGKGLECRTGEELWRLGAPAWAAPGAEVDVGARVVLAREGNRVASFAFAEKIREQAVDEVRGLKKRGIEVVLLSGDENVRVQKTAAELGLSPEWAVGAQSPEGKADWLGAHDSSRTLMLGDGINDSLAFERALVRGTPGVDRGALEEKADFYLPGRTLGGLTRLLDIARFHGFALRAVFLFAVAYNASMIWLCWIGRMNPLVAAVVMPISSVVSIGLVAGTFRIFRCANKRIPVTSPP